MCKKEFTRASKPLKCATCDRECHSGKKCSNLKSSQSKENWRCQECEPQAPKDRCRECGTEERKGQKMIKCSQCQETMHKGPACSKISRSYLEKELKKKNWKCMKCNNPERYSREKTKEKKREETTRSKEKRKCTAEKIEKGSPTNA